MANTSERLGRRRQLLDLLVRAPAPSARRQAALQRARRAILVLDEVMRILADEPHRTSRHEFRDYSDDSDPVVRAAIRVADAASEATSLHRGRLETRAAMELVECIKWAAEQDVLELGMDIEWAVTHLATFGIYWPDLEPKVDRVAFRRAVEAWVASERVMRQRGRRIGRTPEKWPAVHAALKASGLGNGMTDGRSVQKTWERHVRANRNSASS